MKTEDKEEIRTLVGDGYLKDLDLSKLEITGPTKWQIFKSWFIWLFGERICFCGSRMSFRNYQNIGICDKCVDEYFKEI